jgi:hypothetical protein
MISKKTLSLPIQDENGHKLKISSECSQKYNFVFYDENWISLIILSEIYTTCKSIK